MMNYIQAKAGLRRALRSLQASSLYRSHVYPGLKKPFDQPFMEVVHGAWNGVAAACDEQGRQLGEDNVTPTWLRCPSSTRWATWKSPEPRQGCLFNVTALRQVTSHWSEIRALAQAQRQLYVQQRGLVGPLNCLDLFLLTQVLTALPAWLLRRQQQPLRDGQIPTAVAASYKSAAGIQFVARHALATLGLQGPLQSQALVDYAFAQNLLVTETTGRVCSGPRQLLEDYAQVLIEGDTQASPHSLSPPELEAAFAYGLVNAQVELLTCLHCLQTAQVALQSNDDLGQLLSNYDPGQGPWAPLPRRIELLQTTLSPSLQPLPLGLDYPDQELVYWQRFRQLQIQIEASLGRAQLELPYAALRHRLVKSYQEFLNRHRPAEFRQLQQQLQRSTPS